MGREDRARAHNLQRLGEREPHADEVADPFESEEARVPLVGVEHLGRRGAGEFGQELDRAHSPDAQQQLLQQPVLAAAAVEAIGDRAQVVAVLGNVGVEQQQADAPHRDLPDAGVEGAAVRQRQHHLGGGAVRVAQHAQGEAVRVEDGVGLLLPAVGGDRLREIARAVEQPDADDRHAEVGGALQVVPREDPEPAGILRKGGGDAELGGEVADGGGGTLGERLVPPRLGEVGVQVVQPLVDFAHVGGVGGELGEPRCRGLAEEPDGVMAARLPQLGGEPREELAGRFMPRPPQVGGQFVETGEGLWEDSANRKPPDCFHEE